MRADAGIEPITAPALLEVAGHLRAYGSGETLDGLAFAFPRRSRTALSRAVRELMHAGWVVRNADGSIELVATATSAVVEAAAAEAKISDWKKAAHQAMNWIGFVDAAWLVFPERYMANVPIDMPYLSRVGLMAVDNAGSTTIVRKGNTPGTSDLRRRHVEEHLFSRWLAQEYSVR
jgi:hypothetical protein